MKLDSGLGLQFGTRFSETAAHGARRSTLDNDQTTNQPTKQQINTTATASMITDTDTDTDTDRTTKRTFPNESQSTACDSLLTTPAISERNLNYSTVLYIVPFDTGQPMTMRDARCSMCDARCATLRKKSLTVVS